MLEPTVSPRPSVVALAASMILISSVVGGCQREAAMPAAEPAPATPTPPPMAPTPVVALDRAGLIAAMDAAASAYASGVESDQAPLVGRRFVVRQAFGCGGEASRDPEARVEEGLATASRSADGQNLRISLTPGNWTESPLIDAEAEQNWEAVEGVWLNRPWLRSGACPRLPPSDGGDGPADPSPQSMGLASVFEAEGSRLGRRNGRAYEYTVRGVDDQPAVAPAQGYRLVLEGRVSAFSKGPSIRCRASGPDQRPICIAAVQIDRVAFEDAAGAVLSDWRAG